MRIVSRFFPKASVVAALLAALAGSSCSTVRPAKSSRQGFFDQIARSGGKGYAAPESESRESRKKGVQRDPAAIAAVALRAKKISLRWPLDRVYVTSHFGSRNRSFHEGIDLRAKSGTPVYASAAGTVLYADKRISGYGRMVVVRHPGGLTTVYAHNAKLLVKRGQKVKRGQRIALSGNSGRSSGPHVHFEIRDGVAPIDPWKVLPRATLAMATGDDDHLAEGPLESVEDQALLDAELEGPPVPENPIEFFGARRYEYEKKALAAR